MTDDTVRTQLAKLEVRLDEGLRAVRERVEGKTAESLRRFDAHADDDARRFDRIDAVLVRQDVEAKAVSQRITEKLDAIAIGHTSLAAKIGGYAAGGAAVAALAAWVLEHLVTR